MALHLPVDHRVGHTRGAAAGNPIALPAVKATDTLLAVVSYGAGGAALVGHDPAAFTPAAGEIESATVDTSGKFVVVLWAVAP